ncbi:MAG TPA: GNAT family N-acetyltransferase [Humibacter sp.]|jgi:ribosomal protein S18 acetylase RimI-like enzyme|nr:GNAT family N-acetyltransferase [Humibacter sp.]
MDGLMIRRAAASDSGFLRDMLVEAANGGAEPPRSRVAVLDDPNMGRYLAQWPRPGDIGLVAVDRDGTPVGACWARLFPADAPGSGFVASGVPELTLGVNSQWRALGVGRALLQSLHGAVKAGGYTRVSLSVRRTNVARRLYVSEGYTVVSSSETTDVMVRVLV